MKDGRGLETQTKVMYEPAKIFLHEIEVKGLVKLMAHFYRFRLLAGGW